MQQLFRDAPGALTPSDPAPFFKLEGVGFSVPGRTLLNDITLELPAGRIIGLVGHNGSGKSTLLGILARQQTASAGDVSCEGKPLAEWRDRSFARKVAYLPQQTPPAHGLLVKELVALGRYPWHGALARFGTVDREKVAEAIELADIAPFADRLVDTLSGGERQRAWLAMLIAQDTRCLLLDEPISALDIAHQIEVLALVRRLSRSRGLAVVVVLHDVNMAARFCEEIIALKAGRLITRGPPAEIMTPQQLNAIYGIGMEVMISSADGHYVAVPR